MGCGVVWLWKGAGRGGRAWRGRAGCVVRLVWTDDKEEGIEARGHRGMRRGRRARALVRVQCADSGS